MRRYTKLFAALCTLSLFAPLAARAEADCVPVGTWVAPGAPPQRLASRELFARAAARSVVLLGETHDNAEHHRWELQTIAALHALHPDMVLALEMFPRRVQRPLDRWVAGELTQDEFLTAAEWRAVWQFDPQLYLPMFHFARMNRVPMVAVNVESALTRAVAKDGFDAVPEEKREGVTRPAPATDAYIETLLDAYSRHAHAGQGDAKVDRNDPAFKRFVESQLVWDRAMAQGIAGALARSPSALVVGVMGSGHLVNGFGVVHQLRDLNVSKTMVLLPWDHGTDCAGLAVGLADAVFGVMPPEKPAPRPRLGVSIELTSDGVAVREVEKGSVAEATGIQGGDVVLEIAGLPARQPGEVVEAIQRQAPGTWLPIKVRRKGETLDLIAKFPPLSK